MKKQFEILEQLNKLSKETNERISALRKVIEKKFIFMSFHRSSVHLHMELFYAMIIMALSNNQPNMILITESIIHINTIDLLMILL